METGGKKKTQSKEQAVTKVRLQATLNTSLNSQQEISVASGMLVTSAFVASTRARSLLSGQFVKEWDATNERSLCLG